MYFLSGMFIQDAKVFEDLNLSLGSQILIPKKHHTTVIDERSEFIELLIVQLTQLNVF